MRPAKTKPQYKDSLTMTQAIHVAIVIIVMCFVVGLCISHPNYDATSGQSTPTSIGR